MDIRIQSIHFDASEQLQDFVKKKTNKLGKFCDDITTAEVSLKVIKPETVENKEVGIKLFVLGETLYARKVCNTFEQAVDDALEALEKQIHKYKEKQPNK
ncbi:ribosome-associated translation inhibitor RaiA [termite gut metagenome]|uniref:Ribosome-associated translation inhibitor RaiA n=1 Tax=termite gut metagenome TaxID=433724 RepID=A0A5J4S9X8_9ZZZZ